MKKQKKLIIRKGTRRITVGAGQVRSMRSKTITITVTRDWSRVGGENAVPGGHLTFTLAGAGRVPVDE